jgi:hypothetical protein
LFSTIIYCAEEKQQEMDSLTKLLAGKKTELDALNKENEQGETMENYKKINSFQVDISSIEKEINCMLMQQMAIGKYMYHSY